MVGFIQIAHNGLALGEEADFEALNYLPALNFIRRTKLHLSTEPAFLPNACYKQFLFDNFFIVLFIFFIVFKSGIN